MPRIVKVLIIDDSALVREVLSQGFQADPGIQVVGTAADPFQARDRIVELRPDVLTLDIEMPRMDGLEFLRKLMPQYPLPVIVVSALTERGKRLAVEALEAGAVEVVTKPSTDLARGLQSMMMELRTKVKLASVVNLSHWKNRPLSRPALAGSPGRLEDSSDQIIVIGASTGGTEAIRSLLERFPPDSPGVVVVQHMPPGFTRLFAERINTLTALEVKEAEEGDRIRPGRALIAPGGKHMRVVRSGGIFQVHCQPGALVNGHCPSVDVLMESASRAVGRHAIGVLLTGMGGDGARGLLQMRQAGARTLAQDEASCVVFGMPKVAWELGAAERLVPLSEIPEAVFRLLPSLEQNP